jgi:hypothetical protein
LGNLDNLALEDSSPKTGSFAFYEKKASSVKLDDLMIIFIKVSKSAFTSTLVVPPNFLPPTPATSSAIKTPNNTHQEPDDPEPADEGDIQMDYSSD